MENTNSSNKENEKIKEEENAKNNQNDKENEKNEKAQENANIQTSNIINENNKKKEEEKKMSEGENKEKILRQKKLQQMNIREIRLNEMEKRYNDLFNDIVINWEKNRENYNNFYDTIVNNVIEQMFTQPCIVANQELIIYIFKFLCNYFNFLKDKLNEIPIKHLYIMDRILDFNTNLSSKNPKINNSYNYDTFNEGFELISDKLFYYLFKEMLPKEEIENPLLDLYYYNCMMKYLLEYLFKIGFIDNFINIFLYRGDIDNVLYINFACSIFNFLNYCDEKFILKNNYKTNLIQNFTTRMTFWLNNSQSLINKNKDYYLHFLKRMTDNYYSIIYGGLGYILEKYEKNNKEEDIHNFLYSIYNYYEFLLKQQKLELRIFAISKLVVICDLTKYDNNLKKIFNATEKVFEYTKKFFISFLVKINFFDLVFGENIHEALIERSYKILSLLYKNNKFTPEQISFLWKISQSKYQSISNSIITLFGKILPEFSNDDCNSILQIISSFNISEVNEVTLKLLENFFLSEHRHPYLLNILFKYSNELTFYKGLSGNIIDKSRNILKKLFFNKKYVNDMIQSVKNSLFCMDNNYLLNTSRNLLFDIMNEFIHTEKNGQTIDILKTINENISNFGMLLSYLDEKYSLFLILMNYLLFIKKFFIFFTEETIRLNTLINKEKITEIDSLLNEDDFLSKFKEYQKMSISDDDINKIINNNDSNNENYLLPKNKDDVDNYMKIIIKEFISFLKDNILGKNIKYDSEIIDNIFNKFEFSFEKNTYHRILIKVIDTIFNFHEFGNNYIKKDLLDFLYFLLVENAYYQGEKEIYFDFIKNILIYQYNNYHLNLITDENIEYICLQKISANEISSLPFSAYEAINLYLRNTNDKNGNIVYSPVEEKFKEIKKINLLIGFKTLLHFYICNNDINITTKASSNLTNIIEVACCDMNNRKYLLDELFLLLDQYQKKIKETICNASSKISFRKILKLISMVNKTKVSKNIYDKNDPNNLIEININNNFFNNNDDNHFVKYKAFKGLTVKEFKNELIEKIICTNVHDIILYNNININPYHSYNSLPEIRNELKNNDYIIICYKDLILKNDFTLDDYDIKSGDNIILLNSFSSGPQGPQANGGYFWMSDALLNDAYSQIRVVFNDRFSEELMKEALYQNKGDIQNTIIYMTDDDNITTLINNIEKRKKNEPKKKEAVLCLEEKQFNILLGILNEGDSDINDCVWELFSEINFPEDFIIKSIESGLDLINNEKNLNKKILIFEIINSVIFDDNSFCKNNKLDKNKKNKWISTFMNNEKSLIENLIFLSGIKIEKSSEINDFLQIIDIFVNYFKKIFAKIAKINKNNTENKININYSKKKEDKEDIYGEFDIQEKDINNFIKILTKNNFVNLIYNILEVVIFRLNKEHIQIKSKTKKKNITQNIYDILIDYLKISPNDIKTFLEEEKKNKIILKILTSEKEEVLRKHSLDFLKNLNIELKSYNDNSFNIQSSLLNIYYPYLLSNDDDDAYTYKDEIYKLYDYLFNCDSLNLDIVPIDKIIDKFFDNLCEFNFNDCKEKKANANEHQLNDNENKIKYNLYILNSFCPKYNEVLKNVIEKKLLEKKDVITLLYNCIFKIIEDKDQNPTYLFSDEQLRKNAFDLISNLISIDQKFFNIISPLLINHHTKILQKKSDLPLDSSLRDIKSKKFLGLKNFGATCYLNSLFQQMYMIPTFKKDIFDFNIIEDKENYKKEELDESTLYNMQISFANLQKSIMAYYPPISFIKSFKKAFNGEPIHLGVQQDTDEFLAILCDKIEKEAKKFGKENFLENSFRGKITNEIVSLEKEYPYYSQTEEPFYSITLDIKGHKNLEDALDAYVKGEILEGDNQYYVEKYKKKISIKKRTSIKKIGNQIIIHLKRFEFNFITFQNNKLNDYLKFPFTINFKKWTRASLRMNEVNVDEANNNISEEEKENLDEEKMNYELTGILVHSGSSLQSGHYYSFIKDQESNKWYKFNDSVVSDYNIYKDLEKECFGSMNSKTNQFERVAYLLFYTKKECVDKYKNISQVIKINENILKQVHDENIDFLQIKTFASEDYHKFFLKFINLSLNFFKKELKEDEDNTINKEKDYSLLMNEQLKKEVEIYEKVFAFLKENNKEKKIDIDENGFIVLPENIEEIYEKCKNETQTLIIGDINENINMTKIIKLFFYYFYGLVIQYNDKEVKLRDCVTILKDIINDNKKFTIDIMKLIEDNINIFIDLFFKYGFIDKDMTSVNQHIYDMYKTLFHCNYLFEKEKYGHITTQCYTHFIRDNEGKLKLEKIPKSLFLRLFKKLYLDNLEKGRLEYQRETLFLNLLLLTTISCPESCLISNDYLIPLISFITNNNLPEYKSAKNPNFKMGTGPNAFYLSLFCDIILRCATPWMQATNNETPYYALTRPLNEENKDFSLCPKLPKDWEKMITKSFFIDYILSSKDTSCNKVLCHLCYGDESTSVKIMKLINNLLKEKSYRYKQYEIIFSNLGSLFEMNDSLTNIRLEALFELESKDNGNGQQTLIDFYFNTKYELPLLVLEGLLIISKAIEAYKNVYEYFKKNKNKLEWVKDYYMEFFSDEDKHNLCVYLENIINIHPDVFEVIETQIINKLDV